MMRCAKRSVIVLIDDLDRLDGAEIMTMLKLVRLTANVPRVVYLLAFDDEMVAKAAGSFYNDDLDAGRQFLEKIVQFPFTIPAVGQERLVNYVLRHAHDAADAAILTLNDLDWATFRELTDQSLSRRLTTPRQAIRYGSALKFALPMLKGEVDPLEQMVIEGLRVLFPELYAHLRDNSGLFTRPEQPGFFAISEEELTRYVRSAMQTPEEVEIEAGTALLKFLFRNVREISQPIRESCYFNRHFGYALAADEISDAEMSLVLARAEAPDARLPELTNRLAEKNSAELLVLLRRRFYSISGQQFAALARALVSCAPRFLSGDRVKRDDGGETLAALLAEFVRRVRWPSVYDRDGAQERHRLAADIVKQIQPLALVPVFIEALGRLDLQAKGEDERNRIEHIPVIDDENWHLLRDVLLSRISTFAESNAAALFDKNSDGSDLFSAWYVNGLTNLRQWLEQRLVKDPGLGMLLLRLILPDSSSTAAQVNYSFIAEVVAPAVLATALSTHLGSKLEEIDDGSPDILFARSFLDEYKRHHSTSEAANDAVALTNPISLEDSTSP